jgi:hypothetical protein
VVPIAAEHYAENNAPSLDVTPVIVSVLKAKWPPYDLLEVEVAGLTAAIAQVCGRPAENVHIIYSPEATGRVAFGGKLFQV